ncbi:hypothetical protein SNK04_014298 [Fusarium graminearum]
MAWMNETSSSGFARELLRTLAQLLQSEGLGGGPGGHGVLAIAGVHQPVASAARDVDASDRPLLERVASALTVLIHIEREPPCRNGIEARLITLCVEVGLMDVEPDCLGRVVEIALVVRSLAIHVQLKPTELAGVRPDMIEDASTWLAWVPVESCIRAFWFCACWASTTLPLNPCARSGNVSSKQSRQTCSCTWRLPLRSLSRLQIRAAFSAVITYPQGLCGLGRWPGARGSASCQAIGAEGEQATLGGGGGARRARGSPQMRRSPLRRAALPPSRALPPLAASSIHT